MTYNHYYERKRSVTQTIKIAETEELLGEAVLCIYGDSGIGKTTIANNMERPLFLIMRGGGEHRPMPLAGSGTPFIEIFTKAELDKFVLEARRTGLPKLTLQAKPKSMVDALKVLEADELVRTYEPKTLVIDQMTSLYDLILRDVLRNVVRNRPQPDLPGQPDYGQGHRRFLDFIFEINQIPNVHKVYLALAELDEDENTKERYGAPALPGKMAREVLRFFDFVFRMHIKREMRDGKLYEYHSFQTQPDGTWLAKDSSGKLPRYIEIPRPNYDFWNEVIVKAIRA